MRAGADSALAPAARNARTVPVPTPNQRWPAATGGGISARAAFTALGLVNTTRGAVSAAFSAARVAASSRCAMRQGDSAIRRAPSPAAARRSVSCPPAGRNDTTWHPVRRCPGKRGMRGA
jgi:hypothetical protein